MDTRGVVERGTILRATVGSTVHGLHHGGQDDRDEMAVFVESAVNRMRSGQSCASFVRYLGQR